MRDTDRDSPDEFQEFQIQADGPRAISVGLAGDLQSGLEFTLRGAERRGEPSVYFTIRLGEDCVLELPLLLAEAEALMGQLQQARAEAIDAAGDEPDQ